MLIVKSVLEHIKGKETPAVQPAARKQQLVHMGRASKETQGIARGLEFLIYPRGA